MKPSTFTSIAILVTVLVAILGLSACGSGTVQASPTLTAMGVPDDEAIASLRVSFGLPNTAAEIDTFLPALADAVAALRSAALAGARPAR